MGIRLLHRSLPKTDKNLDTTLNLEPPNVNGITRVTKIPSLASYSKYVFFMKLILPAIAIGLVCLVLLWPQMTVKNTRFTINFKNIENSNSENLNMVNARFVGTDAKNQPFSITADIAKNMTIDGTSIELEMPKADIGIDNGTWLAVVANNGIYNQKTQFLNLAGSVNLFHDSGYEFNTEKTTIDLIRGIAFSNVVINGQGPFGNLTAEGFRIEKKNNQFFFTGKSKLVVKTGVNKNVNRQ